MNKRNFGNPDIEYSNNNQVIAIRPTQTGCLKDLVSLTTDANQRLWIFSDVPEWTDSQDNKIIDYQMRGVIVGNYDAGRDFINACHDAGLQCKNTNFSVPFSNGKFDSTWHPGEIRLIRIDLPTIEQIKESLQAASA